jgi:hypothetical protein
MDEASGRKLYRGFVLGGCKYETGDCVYLNAPKNESDEGTTLPFPFPFAFRRAHVGGIGGNAPDGLSEDRFYIAQIMELWETKDGKCMLSGRWFYQQREIDGSVVPSRPKAWTWSTGG